MSKLLHNSLLFLVYGVLISSVFVISSKADELTLSQEQEQTHENVLLKHESAFKAVHEAYDSFMEQSDHMLDLITPHQSDNEQSLSKESNGSLSASTLLESTPLSNSRASAILSTDATRSVPARIATKASAAHNNTLLTHNTYDAFAVLKINDISSLANAANSDVVVNERAAREVVLPDAANTVSLGKNTPPTTLSLDDAVLNIGLSVAPPFVIAENNMTEPVGIEIDIIKELQRRTGFEIAGGKVAVMGFNEVMDLGCKGQLDICAGGLSLTAERAKVYDFSYSYFSSMPALVVHEKSKIASFKDLNKTHIAAEQGTTAEDLIPASLNLKVAIDHTNSNFLSFYRVSRCLSDAVVTDLPLALYYKQHWPDAHFKVVDVLDDVTRLGLLFKKNGAYTAALQQAMQQMKDDGTLERIVKKYVNYGSDLEQAATLALSR